MTNDTKLWGGRFTSSANIKFFDFNRSLAFDQRLFSADITASIAHCNAIENVGIITSSEAKAIKSALSKIHEEGTLKGMSYFDGSGAEDIHSFIEEKLIEAIGISGKKLHAGRSRNDQVATAFRLWVRDSIVATDNLIKHLQREFVELAMQHIDVALPGYTHLQKAQPILFAHWCLAYFEMLRRDRERFADASKRVSVLPLGSAALAGTSFPIDRQSIAAELGFEEMSRNSLDAVSDRDFCVEAVSAAALTMAHLSRLSEDIILYCTSEFGFFVLSDSVATGSSLMPQKKNPDSMELVRGKSGRVFGDLVSILSIIKGLPLAYNKDMQEDKEAVFDAFATVNDCLEVSAIVLKNLMLNTDVMQDAASTGYMNATEFADYLVSKGIAFRDAHEIVGKAVLFAISQKKELGELSLDELRKFAPEIDNDVYIALSLESTMAKKNTIGGTSPNRIRAAVAEAMNYLEK